MSARRFDAGEDVDGVRFSNALVAEAIQPFWAALQAGEFLTDAAVLAGTYRQRGRIGWRRAVGCARAAAAT